MNDGGNQHLAFLQLINDPITVDEQFAEVLVIEFRDFPPRTGKPRQHLRLADDGSHYNRRVSRRVLCDVIGDGFEIAHSAA